MMKCDDSGAPAPTDADEHIASLRFVTTKCLAIRWGVTTRTVERLRASGTGPVFVRIGRSVRYPVDAVARFEAANAASDR